MKLFVYLSSILLLGLLLTGVFFVKAQAQDYTNPNFILRDPVVTISGGRSSTPTFEFYSSVGQTAAGESANSGFTYRAGFLYFPIATSPVVSATAGNEKVDLSWTASSGTLANITNYQVGTSTVAGGPYTFESVGNVLSFSKTGLINGTIYYFKIKADAGTLNLSISAEVFATPTAPIGGGGGGTGGGGGGGYGPGSVTQVNFLGRAYPLSRVTVLKDGQIAVATIAGPDANFNIGLSGLSNGNYVFSVYGEDSQNRRSTLFNFPLYITQGAATTVSGIFLAPTIDVDKSQVARGDNIAIFGQSVPNGEVTIAVNSEQEFFNKVQSDQNGVYLYNFDTAPLENGGHSTKSKTAISGEISSFGKSVGFTVGNISIAKAQALCGKSDINCDGRVNLIDFSITAFWFKRLLSGDFLIIEQDRLNSDNVVNLKDFSIMAYYWTG